MNSITRIDASETEKSKRISELLKLGLENIKKEFIDYYPEENYACYL
jgi:hypothetical protein